MALKISIVVPVYNMGAFLSQLIQNIRDEKYENIELIIIDGGSTDSTSDVIDRNKDIIAFYISEKDRGQADAVNKGLEQVTGDIVHWHAADDLIVPGTLKFINEQFCSDETLDVIFSDGLAWSGNKLVYTGKSKFYSKNVSLFHFARFQSDCCYWRRTPVTASIRVAIDSELTADEDFFLNVVNSSRSYRWCPVPLGVFRVHGAQISQKHDRSSINSSRSQSRKNIYKKLGMSNFLVVFEKAKYFFPYVFLEFVCPVYWSFVRRVVFGKSDPVKIYVYNSLRGYLNDK